MSATAFKNMQYLRRSVLRQRSVSGDNATLGTAAESNLLHALSEKRVRGQRDSDCAWPRGFPHCRCAHGRGVSPTADALELPSLLSNLDCWSAHLRLRDLDS